MTDRARPRPASDPSPGGTSPSASTTSSANRILSTAIWSSFILHLILLVVLPGPGGVRASEGISVTIALAPPPATVEEPLLESPREEDPPEPSVEPPSLPEAAPEVLPTALPEVEPPPPEEEMAAAPQAEDPAAAPQAAPSEPPLATPLTVGSSIVDLDEGKEEPSEAQRIAELLRDTREGLERSQGHEAYRVEEVWNPVKRALQALYDAKSPTSAERESKPRTFDLFFRIDAEGYIFDLSITVTGGELTARETRTLRDTIYAISPLVPPPEGMRTPIEILRNITY